MLPLRMPRVLLENADRVQLAASGGITDQANESAISASIRWSATSLPPAQS
jgi:hypothetical protein